MAENVSKELAKEKKLLAKEEKKRHKESKKALSVREKKDPKLKKSKKNKVDKILEDVEPDYGIRFNPSHTEGLTDDQVNERLAAGLLNDSNVKSTRSISSIILKNVFTFFNILTASIAVWLLTVGAFTDLLFLVIVSANLVIGIIQEIRSKKTIDKLSLMTAPTCSVIRSSKVSEINIKELVLDDVFELSTGKQIPADSIVINGSVEVNESLLTGESDAILKHPGDKLFAGSFITSGTCVARCDRIGSDNYIEKLTHAAKSFKQKKSELLRSLTLIIKVMAFVIIPVGAALFTIQYFLNDIPYVTSVRKTAGAMIGMIPSGLYLLSSVALAVSVMRLAKNNVMVQELYCIEMLARINVLCLDKTGTITDGTMVVKDVLEFSRVAGKDTYAILPSFLEALDDNNVTSEALEKHFGRNKDLTSQGIIPFSSKRKYSAVSFSGLGTYILGAPEFVLKERYTEVKETVEKYAAQGFRVLSLVHKPAFISNDELPTCDFTLVSLILIEDNIRPDAINTIAYFTNTGVDVRVISGDNPLTVSKIAERAGILNASNYISLDGVKDEDVVRYADKYTIFGRVSPNQKALLVRTLKANGHNVAMTGDGVNDILALKEADCSIAVASGSEAARNVSNLVLLDSNFDSMPKVVAEGRRVINNITGVACLFLTKTIFSFLLSMIALTSTGLYPISTIQLSLIDFLCIGLPSFFLILEPSNTSFKGNFLVTVLKKSLPGALTISILAGIVFALSGPLNIDHLSSSTMIILLATTTFLMVLFRVCRPFNNFKTLVFMTCVTLFFCFIFFLPDFFELRPLLPFREYYTDKANSYVIEHSPEIKRAEDNKIVINGVYTNFDLDPDRVAIDKGFKLSATKNGLLIVNDVTTDYRINMPYISFDNDDVLFFYGDSYQDILKSDFVNLFFREDGFLVCKTTRGDKVLTNYLEKNNFYGSDYSLIYNSSTSEYVVHYKGEPKIDKQGKAFVIDLPINTFDADGVLVVDATSVLNTSSNSISLSDFSGASKRDIGVYVDYKTFVLSANMIDIKTQTDFIEPSVLLSKSDNLVYSFTTPSVLPTYYYLDIDIPLRENVTSLKVDFYQKVKDSKEFYMMINGYKTDVLLNVRVTNGAHIVHFSLEMYLLFFTLFLLSTPLMVVLYNAIPLTKKGVKQVLNFLNNR